MRDLPLVLVAVSLSCAAAVAATILARPEPVSRSPAPELGAAPVAVDGRIDALERALADARGRLAALEHRGERRRVGVDEAAVRAAVATWLDAHQGELTAPAAPESATVQTLLARLADEALPLEDRQDVWSDAQQAGLLDELLAVFEQRAAGAPEDPQAQTDLGNACLQAVQYLQNPLKQGDLANRADAAFDRALALDDRHWEARFQKALALSFWPAALGKKGESIRNFEILVEQQDTMPREAQHAQTYLFLGNLYEEQGRLDDARAMWARGLRAFPDSDDLSRRARGR